MNLIANFLIKNLWISVTCILFTLLSLPLTVVFYFLSKKKKVITYDIITNNIIKNNENKYDKLELLYLGKKIRNFSTSRLVLWNSGNEILNSIDISEVDPIRIIIENGQFLEYSILEEVNKDCRVNCIINKEGTEIQVNFNYLGKKNGVILELMHTSISSENIKIIGIIKGHGSPIKNNEKTRNLIDVFEIPFIFLNNKFQSIPILKKVFGAMIAILFTFLMILSVIIIIQNVIFGIVLIVGCLLYIYLGVNLMKGRVPKEFKKFEENLYKANE